jgi:hypothetical protein
MAASPIKIARHLPVAQHEHEVFEKTKKQYGFGWLIRHNSTHVFAAVAVRPFIQVRSF